MEHGKFIQQKRIEQRMSQADLANKIGYSPQTISLWESDKSFPDLIVWGRLALIFKIDLSSFIRSENVKNNNYCETMSFDIERFSNNLRAIRKKNNLTQKDLAKRIVTNNKTISSWEKGMSTPSLNQFVRLCSLYGLEFEELYFAFTLPNKLPKPPIQKKRIFIPIILPIVIIVTAGSGAAVGISYAVQRNKSNKPKPIESETTSTEESSIESIESYNSETISEETSITSISSGEESTETSIESNDSTSIESIPESESVDKDYVTIANWEESIGNNHIYNVGVGKSIAAIYTNPIDVEYSEVSLIVNEHNVTIDNVGEVKFSTEIGRLTLLPPFLDTMDAYIGDYEGDFTITIVKALIKDTSDYHYFSGETSYSMHYIYA